MPVRRRRSEGGRKTCRASGVPFSHPDTTANCPLPSFYLMLTRTSPTCGSWFVPDIVPSCGPRSPEWEEVRIREVRGENSFEPPSSVIRAALHQSVIMCESCSQLGGIRSGSSWRLHSISLSYTKKTLKEHTHTYCSHIQRQYAHINASTQIQTCTNSRSFSNTFHAHTIFFDSKKIKNTETAHNETFSSV